MYAAYLTYTDHEIQRLIDELKKVNQLDNTLIVVMIGDNGASKEGTLYGDIDLSPMTPQRSADEAFKYNLANIDKIGKPEGIEVNYPLGWAQACNTPFRFWKQDAHSEGGTHNPMILFYPKVITDKGGLRNQYSHVIDMLPTTLDIVGIKAPQYIKGIQQDTIQGTSLAYSINNAKAPSRHTQQYYYIFGSRSMYKDGWKAAFAFEPSVTNGLANKFAVEDTLHNDWHLYNLNEDFNERIDLAKKYPEKLAELKALFDAQATENRLYPLVTWDDIMNRIRQMMATQTPKSK